MSANTLRNTNRWDTRTMVTMALLAAISALLSFVEGGNFGGFLNYDASFVPAAIGGFLFGPVPGTIIGIIGASIYGLIRADFWGTVMNVAAVIAFVVPAAIIYRKNKTIKGAIIGLAVGTVLSVIVMILANLVVTPIYTGMPVSAVVEMIIPLLLPFNVCKALANSVLSLLLFKPVSAMVMTDKQKNA